MRALTKEGFDCDAAADGIEAMRSAEEACYDVVVTDMRMPHKHGHALAVGLLRLDPRPVIIILTAVAEPRLAKDLLERGVDDVVFKPVDYEVFASKVKALVDRQLHQNGKNHDQLPRSLPTQLERAEDGVIDGRSTPISLSEIEDKLTPVSRVLPVSRAGLDVFQLACSDSCSAQQLAAAIQRDASLAAEVLRLANSSFYNPSSQAIKELDYAVARIGVRRIGELALASDAFSALTTTRLPWLNVETIWRRSIAAGVAVELLLEQGKQEQQDEGLLLCAIMHALGRVLLGTLYPQHYECMVKACRDRNEPLLEQEKWMFPENHAKTMARLLAIWNIPAEVYGPLNHILEPYCSLARLSDPLRKQVELVKLAILLGQIAAERWEDWDLVEFAPASVLRRLRIHDVAGIVEQTKSDLAQIISFRPQSQTESKQSGQRRDNSDSQPLQLAYSNLSAEPFDFLAATLPSMGVALTQRTGDLDDSDRPMLVNCLGARPPQLASQLNGHRARKLVIVSDGKSIEEFREHGTTVAIPCSCGALRNTSHTLGQLSQGVRASYARWGEDLATLDVWG
jgi:HD-like signal output (HDOD) protein/ActR/RegA family two-component response regulator